MKLVINIDDEQVLFDIKNRGLEAETETDKVIINALYNGTPMEQEPSEEYKRGWHDAIATALKETHNYYTDDGVFKAIQEESLVGVGMSMQEPKTDGDCVSRQAVIDILTRNGVHFCDMVKITSDLKELPPVKPQEPKTGHWLIKEDNTSFVRQIPRKWVECSYCHWSFSYNRIKDDYCSRCGCKMESEGVND